ncbi:MULTISPECIES: chemotaxis protein CheW [Thalassospira]|uniref:Chemotaxis protein CheA n=1 Tax=Thalassospira profundimaris TaxID=502049 RepID=A0A367V7H5_9PROT|nr:MULTISPECIES: chemotaxis protein CheW [Thalassospira]MBR9902233.1 hybrid sensor histidine kinase/response regulator [Rhodospirillales bacterium]KZB73189.1 ATPase [Thalassospira sp. MCCC 1A01148]MBO6809375.1 chemotaxis protein CheW [Thalassospira sp.]MBO6841890.1 chemotaxis protein CheW [Thalassospira sp.]RCK20230.1 ATPase [Thalassospira profundimaris]
MDDLLSEFLTETSESLSTLDVELVKLEQNPNDPDILSNIFRLVHTIKGTCGFLGLPRLEAVAHAGENVLGKIRDGELVVTADAVTLVLESIDTIKYLLGELEQNEAEPDGNDAELIARLNHFADTGEIPGAAPAADAAPAAEEAAAEEVEMTDDEKLQAAFDAAEYDPDFEIPDEPAAAAEPEPEAPAKPTAPPAAAKSQEVAPAKKPAEKAKAEAPRGETKESSVAAQTIRVNVELLENLMTLVSELVLTRNQLLQMVRGKDDSEFTVPLQRLSHITTDLQEGVMKTRMQPIGNAWAKLPRIVRDLALEMNKKIDLQMIGADTELDRQVLELIKDPLTHMVRNSADHGLEDIPGRREAGKPETGTVTLNAYHEGGHIIIEISDDGRGLNLERIKAKAISNGLTTESELEGMADQQIQQFIFKAGFSTAEKVTSVSGRGVGMDVVRTNIEKIGGTVELKSVEGRGSTFIIKIPLTLAIVSALIVESGGERFAIPQISVLELVRASNNSEHSIERIHDTPVLRLRNRLLPLVTLKRILGLDTSDATDDSLDEEAFIVVAQVGTYSFGIIVDRVFDTEEIVVKPVAPILRDLSLFSGNTILGDGSVIMILDPNGIATRTGEITVGGSQGVEGKAKQDASDRETTSMLVFRAGGNEVRAVPLALVARLEEIDVENIEHSNGRPLVQYRGKLMPLVFIDGNYQMKSEGRQPTLVFQDRERTMGLVVDEIVDIVDDVLNVELTADQDGLVGSAVIDGKATDLIDAGYYLELAFSDWFGTEDSGGEKKRVLLIDDSPFFRNLLTPMLSVAGFNVTAVETAEQAMELKNRGNQFDAIISDIEMPGMNGFEFAEALQDDAEWGDIPIIALSSHTSEEDFERGRQVGFSDYVAKFDRDALVSTLIQTLSSM